MVLTGIFPSDYTDGTSLGDYHIYNSARCGGPYQISGTAREMLLNCSARDRMMLGELIWRLRPSPSSSMVVINSDHVSRVRSIAAPTIPERLERGLRSLVRRFPKLGQYCELAPDTDIFLEFLGASFSADADEASALLEELDKQDLISLKEGTLDSVAEFSITVNGHIAADRPTVNAELTQVFVAMWFASEMNEPYELGIDPAIRECGYLPFRVDRKEHNNKIDDEIVAAIHSSRFVVADFTSEPDKPRGGVYYEAGLAQGIGLPVIWMCRADMIEKVHFDTRQFNHITWTTYDELRQKLRNRILATIGRGPNSIA